MIRRPIYNVMISFLALAISGCTVHPAGEQDERRAALDAGKPFEKPAAQRVAPPFPDNPTPENLVRYALLTNADLEQRYWEWRSAIEQIPQDGTQPTNLAISAGTTLNKGNFSTDRTTLTAINDPMADIVWPDKLSVAAKRALENARAAGLRFQQAKFDLRNRVLGAYYDYALDAELSRLESQNVQLLQTMLMAVEARNRTGLAGQQEVLKARNELDESRNDLANMKSQLPALVGAINAILNRDVHSSLPVPAQLPPIRPIDTTDEQLLALAAKQNPQLAALAWETKGKSDGIRLARLQYMPDFSLSAGTDLAGVAQSLTGMLTVPLLRHQAIDAAVAQAEANLRTTEARLRQAGNDLGAQVVMDLSIIRDADRQLDLLKHTVLPRARQVVIVSRAAYEAGQSSLLDLLEAQKSLIAIERLVARLQVTRERRLDDLEAITRQPLEREHLPTTQQ